MLRRGSRRAATIGRMGNEAALASDLVGGLRASKATGASRFLLVFGCRRPASPEARPAASEEALDLSAWLAYARLRTVQFSGQAALHEAAETLAEPSHPSMAVRRPSSSPVPFCGSCAVRGW